MSKIDQKTVKKSEFLMAKLKNHSKSLKISQKSLKTDKNEWQNFTLRNDPLKVLAMGVDDGGQKWSKEGLIFKIPYAKLKNTKKQ